jgi:hypothetical protein
MFRSISKITRPDTTVEFYYPDQEYLDWFKTTYEDTGLVTRKETISPDGLSLIRETNWNSLELLQNFRLSVQGYQYEINIERHCQEYKLIRSILHEKGQF